MQSTKALISPQYTCILLVANLSIPLAFLFLGLLVPKIKFLVACKTLGTMQLSFKPWKPISEVGVYPIGIEPPQPQPTPT